jgi:hypothetical protein
MKRFRLREVALLLLPALSLGGLAYYFASKEKNHVATGPWRPLIEEIQFVPVTPRDAYYGYDTKVRIKVRSVGHADTPPHRLSPRGMLDFDREEFVATKNGVERVLDGGDLPRTGLFSISYLFPIQDESSEDYHGDVLLRMKMRKVPPEAGQLSVRGRLTYRRLYPDSEKQSKGEKFDMVLRPPDTTTSPPRISRLRPYTIETKEEKSAGLKPGWGRQLRVTVLPSEELKEEMESSGQGLRIVWLPIDGENGQIKACIIDTKGRRYTQFKDVKGQFKPFEASEYFSHFSHHYPSQFEFPLAQLPAGRLVFHALLTVNDSWPLPVEAVIREK